MKLSVFKSESNEPEITPSFLIDGLGETHFRLRFRRSFCLRIFSMRLASGLALSSWAFSSAPNGCFR